MMCWKKRGAHEYGQCFSVFVGKYLSRLNENGEIRILFEFLANDKFQMKYATFLDIIHWRQTV